MPCVRVCAHELYGCTDAERCRAVGSVFLYCRFAPPERCSCAPCSIPYGRMQAGEASPEAPPRKTGLFKGLVSALGSGAPPQASQHRGSHGRKTTRASSTVSDPGGRSERSVSNELTVRKSGRYGSAVADETYDPSAVHKTSLGIFKPLAVSLIRVSLACHTPYDHYACVRFMHTYCAAWTCVPQHHSLPFQTAQT